MLRYATISSLNCVRNLCGNTVRGHLLKCKPKLIQTDSIDRYQSTLPGCKVTTAASLELTRVVGNTTVTVKASAKVEFAIAKTNYLDPRGSSWDSSDSEQEPVPTDLQIDEIKITVASDVEPTLASLGRGAWYPQGSAQQCLEFLHCYQGTGRTCRCLYRQGNKRHLKELILDQCHQLRWEEIERYPTVRANRRQFFGNPDQSPSLSPPLL